MMTTKRRGRSSAAQLAKLSGSSAVPADRAKNSRLFIIVLSWRMPVGTPAVANDGSAAGPRSRDWPPGVYSLHQSCPARWCAPTVLPEGGADGAPDGSLMLASAGLAGVRSALPAPSAPRPGRLGRYNI